MNDRSKMRAQKAREHDHSPMIDDLERTVDQQGRFGGDLQTDVGTQASLERVRDAEAREGVDKQDKINHASGTSNNQPADRSR